MKKIIKNLLCVVLIFIISSNAFAGAWIQFGNFWKYQKDDGTFLTSTWELIKTDNDYKTYYFDENGNMATGLKKINGEIYAFNDDGSTVTNSKVVIDGEEYPTKNKGLVEGLPTDFDVVSYNERKALDHVNADGSLASDTVLENWLKESAANLTPEEKAKVEAEEMQKKLLDESKAAAAEAERVARANNTISLDKLIPSAVTVEGEDGGKVVVTLLIPILKGGNAEAINAVLEEKIKHEVYLMYEEKYSTTTSKLNYRVKGVQVLHDLDKNMLTFRFANKEGWNMFTLYMNTVTLEMWGDN